VHGAVKICHGEDGAVIKATYEVGPPPETEAAKLWLRYCRRQIGATDTGEA
jgi:hypothetical protein